MHFKLKVNFDQISNCENDTWSQIWNTYFHMVCFEYLWDSKTRSGKDSRCLTRPGLEPNIRNIQVPCTTNHHHWGGHRHSCCIYRGLAVIKQQPSKYSLSPLCFNKNVPGQNIPDNVLRCSLSGSVATNPNCPNAKTKDKVSTTEKGDAGQKELFQDAFSYKCHLRYIITH